VFFFSLIFPLALFPKLRDGGRVRAPWVATFFGLVEVFLFFFSGRVLRSKRWVELQRPRFLFGTVGLPWFLWGGPCPFFFPPGDVPFNQDCSSNSFVGMFYSSFLLWICRLCSFVMFDFAPSASFGKYFLLLFLEIWPLSFLRVPSSLFFHQLGIPFFHGLSFLARW